MMSAVSTRRYVELAPERGKSLVRRLHVVRTKPSSPGVHSWGATMAIQTLKRWGNSLAVRIPASIAQEARLTEGQAIDVHVVDGKVQIARCTAVKRFSRERYVQQLRAGELEPHEAIDFGLPQGSEFGGPEEPR